uniref:Fc receptor, IgE, high affinity I, gamma polypeptide like n=1 Tax=Labrus bergylta TaxID=56723 RepID=A0A3Q3EHT3_9LABR
IFGSHVFVVTILFDLCSEAIDDMNVCYILDGVLIFYGIVLTVLYYRLRSRSSANTCCKYFFCNFSVHEVFIYSLCVRVLQGLTSQSSDFYETIRMDKKPIV